MKKHIFLLCFITLAMYGKMFPSDGFDGNNKPVKSAVRQYAKEHIMPALIQKRQELERELTTTEKNEIADCRATLKQLREQQKELMQQKPEGMTMREYMEQNGNNTRFDAHKQMKAVMERLQAIAGKHSNTLDKIKSDLEPSVKQWKADIARLQPQQSNPDNGGWQHHYRGGMQGGMFHGLNGEHTQAHFLLLSANVSDNEAALDNELKSDPLSSSASAISSFQILPNPASNEFVTGNGAMPLQNELVVYDLQGKAVVNIQNVQPSQHIDVSTLANGTYIVQLKSGEQEQNQKLVVSH